MKKNFFKVGTIAAATSALFMVSCSNDDIMPSVSTGDDVQVSFSIANPYGAVTRAIAKAESVNQLTYAVYDGEGNLTGIVPVTMDAVFPQVVNITLAKGQDYKIVFWADAKDAGMYTFDAATANIAVDYKVHNNDVADAFFAMQEVNVTSDATLDVTLYRPFAQLNVGTADGEVAEAAGVVIETSEVTIKGLANQLNLLDGTTAGDVEFTFPATAILNDVLEVDEAEYTYLAMDYLLVPANKSTVEAAYTFTPNTGNAIERTVTAIPVQANYRTNLLGNVLTADVALTVKIDPIFNLPDNNITLVSGLAAVAKNGGEVTLAEDILLNETVVFEADAVINLNGKTVKMADNLAGVACPFKVDNGATLVINGEGTVDAGKDAYTANIAVWAKNGKVIINGGHFINDYALLKDYTTTDSNGNTSNYSDLIYTTGGDIEINGGTFESRCNSWNNHYYVLNQHNSLGGAIVVKGGTFVNYDPSTGDDNLGGNFVANGYASVETAEGVWTVGPKTGAALVESLTGDATSIYVAANAAITSDVVVENKTITGKPFTVAGSSAVFNNVVFNNGQEGQESGVYVSNGAENVVFDGCTFENCAWDGLQATAYTLNSITVNNCVFNNTASVYRNIHIELVKDSKAYVSETAKAVITNNTFINPAYATNSAITCAGILQANSTISGNIVTGEGEINEKSFWFATANIGASGYTTFDWAVVEKGFSAE